MKAKRQRRGRPSRLLYLLATLGVTALMAGAFAYGSWLEARSKRVCGCVCVLPGYKT